MHDSSGRDRRDRQTSRSERLLTVRTTQHPDDPEPRSAPRVVIRAGTHSLATTDPYDEGSFQYFGGETATESPQRDGSPQQQQQQHHHFMIAVSSQEILSALGCNWHQLHDTLTRVSTEYGPHLIRAAHVSSCPLKTSERSCPCATECALTPAPVIRRILFPKLRAADPSVSSSPADVDRADDEDFAEDTEGHAPSPSFRPRAARGIPLCILPCFLRCLPRHISLHYPRWSEALSELCLQTKDALVELTEEHFRSRTGTPNGESSRIARSISERHVSILAMAARISCSDFLFTSKRVHANWPFPKIDGVDDSLLPTLESRDMFPKLVPIWERQKTSTSEDPRSPPSGSSATPSSPFATRRSPAGSPLSAEESSAVAVPNGKLSAPDDAVARPPSPTVISQLSQIYVDAASLDKVFGKRPPIESCISKSPEIKSVETLLRKGIETNNLNLLLRCKRLPKSTRNYIYKMRRILPQVRLYVFIEDDDDNESDRVEVSKRAEHNNAPLATERGRSVAQDGDPSECNEGSASSDESIHSQRDPKRTCRRKLQFA